MTYSMLIGLLTCTISCAYVSSTYGIADLQKSIALCQQYDLDDLKPGSDVEIPYNYLLRKQSDLKKTIMFRNVIRVDFIGAFKSEFR